VKETATTNDAALDLLAPRPGEDILEIGFGPGRTLGLLVERGAQVTGVDVSAEMVRLAGRRNSELIRTGALTLQRGDGVTLPVDDNSLDAVLAVHNLYFWPKPEATIAEIARVLRPGGRILMVFRGREHPLPNRLDPNVYADVTTDQCVAWLASAGLDSQCHHPNGVPPEVSFVLARRSPRGLLDSGIHAP
jgi:SAM-dependent methyltransferase